MGTLPVGNTFLFRDMKLSFNVKGTTTRGKLLKTLFTDPGLQQSDQSCNINIYDSCEKCGLNAPSAQTVKCEICDVKFHTSCLTHPLPDNFVTLQSTNPCMWWFCLNCTGNAEKELGNTPAALDNSSSSLLLDLKQVVAEQLASLKVDLMQDVNHVIESKLNSAVSIENHQSSDNFDLSTCGSESSLYSRPTFASITSSNVTRSAFSPSSQTPKKPQPAVAKPAEVLMLSPIEADKEFSAADIDQVKKSIGGKLKHLQVEFVHSNPKKKTIAVGFRDQKLRDQGNEVICADAHLSAMGFQSKMANKLLPKITISGVPVSILESITCDDSTDKDKMRELEKKIIVEKIKEKNPSIANLVDLEHTLSVVFVGRVKRFEKDTLTIGLKVSPLIRSTLFLQQCGMIYLDYSRYQVYDRYYIKQCYHCQLLGHTSDDCPDNKASKPSVCMYCSENHRSKMCPNKQKTELHNCTRCKLSGLKSDSSGYTSHHAGSTNCPMMMRETVRLANMTDLTSKNVM